MPSRMVEQDEFLVTGYYSFVPRTLNKASRLSLQFPHLPGKAGDRENAEEVQYEALDGASLGVRDVF